MRHWGLWLWGGIWTAWSVAGLIIGQPPLKVLAFIAIHAVCIFVVYCRLESP